MLLLAPLLACTTPYAPPAEIVAITAAGDGTHYADADVPLGIRVSLLGDTSTFSGWDTWPTFTATLSSGTWHGDTDATTEVTISEPDGTTLWAKVDPDAVSVDVYGVLKIGNASYPAEQTIDLCPSEIGFVTLLPGAASVETGDAIDLTATVYTPSGGTPTLGTVVTFQAEDALTEFDREMVLTDASGVAATRARTAVGASTVTFTAKASPRIRGECPTNDVDSSPATVAVTEPTADTADTADTAGE